MLIILVLSGNFVNLQIFADYDYGLMMFNATFNNISVTFYLEDKTLTSGKSPTYVNT
jgi:hypothetical protein